MKKETNKNRTKTVILIVFAVMLLLGVISWILLYVTPDVLTLQNEEGQAANNSVGMYGSQHSYIYYPIDYDLDITKVEEYMALDRSIYYTDGAETYALTDEDINALGNDVRFFVEYFKYVIDGDFEAYNSLFTENYYKTNEPYYSFTSQMLYDINITKLECVNEDGSLRYSYNVSYKIYRNNGTFRNDIGSDGSKTLYFELVSQDGKILIDKIDYYV